MPVNIFKNLFTEILKIGRGIKTLRFFKFGHLRNFLNVLGKKEKILLLVLIALIALDLSAMTLKFYINNTAPAPGYGGSFSEGFIGEPKLINPLIAQSATDQALAALIYSGLYKYSGSEIVPDLAAALPEISADQKQYTVRLKKNLRWQDNQSLNADDIFFTYQLLQNPDYKIAKGKLWKNVKIEKIDDLTLKFTNKDVSAPFLSNLTLGILPAHLWSKVSAAEFYFIKYNIEPVGSGPFSVNEINKLISGNIRSINLAAFAGYQPQRPYLNSLTVKFYADQEQLITALHTNEIAAIGFVPLSSTVYIDQSKTNLEVNKIPLEQYQALFFNFKNSPGVLGDANVRKALSKSIDRDDYVKDVFSGLALSAYTPILPSQPGYDAALLEEQKYDLAQANKILDQSGWKLNSQDIRARGKETLKFTITTSDFAFNQKSAEYLKRQWQRIGADITLNIIPAAELEKNYIRTRNYEALLFAESSGFDPDPFIFWHSSQANDPGLNIAGYKNKIADRLISEGRNNLDPQSRNEKYREFASVFLGDMPAIILAQSVFVYQTQPKIKTLLPQTLASEENRFYDIRRWYVNTKRVWK